MLLLLFHVFYDSSFILLTCLPMLHEKTNYFENQLVRQSTQWQNNWHHSHGTVFFFTFLWMTEVLSQEIICFYVNFTWKKKQASIHLCVLYMFSDRKPKTWNSEHYSSMTFTCNNITDPSDKNNFFHLLRKIDCNEKYK